MQQDIKWWQIMWMWCVCYSNVVQSIRLQYWVGSQAEIGVAANSLQQMDRDLKQLVNGEKWRNWSTKPQTVGHLNLSLLKSQINFKFLLWPHQKYDLKTTEELCFPSLTLTDEIWLYSQFSLHHLYSFSLEVLENVLFELQSERVN